MTKFAQTTTTIPVYVEGQVRSEKWEVYLFGQVVDMPAVVNDSCLMVQTVQKTVEFFAQLQYI